MFKVKFFSFQERLPLSGSHILMYSNRESVCKVIKLEYSWCWVDNDQVEVDSSEVGVEGAYEILLDANKNIKITGINHELPLFPEYSLVPTFYVTNLENMHPQEISAAELLYTESVWAYEDSFLDFIPLV
jgi:hypothetical protein